MPIFEFATSIFIYVHDCCCGFTQSMIPKIVGCRCSKLQNLRKQKYNTDEQVFTVSGPPEYFNHSSLYCPLFPIHIQMAPAAAPQKSPQTSEIGRSCQRFTKTLHLALKIMASLSCHFPRLNRGLWVMGTKREGKDQT